MSLSKQTEKWRPLIFFSSLHIIGIWEYLYSKSAVFYLSSQRTICSWKKVKVRKTLFTFKPSTTVHTTYMVWRNPIYIFPWVWPCSNICSKSKILLGGKNIVLPTAWISENSIQSIFFYNFSWETIVIDHKLRQVW